MIHFHLNNEHTSHGTFYYLGGKLKECYQLSTQEKHKGKDHTTIEAHIYANTVMLEFKNDGMASNKLLIANRIAERIVSFNAGTIIISSITVHGNNGCICFIKA